MYQEPWFDIPICNVCGRHIDEQEGPTCEDCNQAPSTEQGEE